MSCKYKNKYTYDHGVSLFVIYYNGHAFDGTAICHDDDKDFESERVGLTIAESRANIKVLRRIRDCEI